MKQYFGNPPQHSALICSLRIIIEQQPQHGLPRKCSIDKGLDDCGSSMITYFLSLYRFKELEKYILDRKAELTGEK